MGERLSAENDAEVRLPGLTAIIELPPLSDGIVDTEILALVQGHTDGIPHCRAFSHSAGRNLGDVMLTSGLTVDNGRRGEPVDARRERIAEYLTARELTMVQSYPPISEEHNSYVQMRLQMLHRVEKRHPKWLLRLDVDHRQAEQLWKLGHLIVTEADQKRASSQWNYKLDLEDPIERLPLEPDTYKQIRAIRRFEDEPYIAPDDPVRHLSDLSDLHYRFGSSARMLRDTAAQNGLTERQAEEIIEAFREVGLDLHERDPNIHIENELSPDWMSGYTASDPVINRDTPGPVADRAKINEYFRQSNIDRKASAKTPGQP